MTHLQHTMTHCLLLTAIQIMSAASPHVSRAQWPADVESAGRGGAAGALPGHLTPLRPAQLPEAGFGVEIGQSVPLGLRALAASSVRTWHARHTWSGSLGLDMQSFDAWSAFRPYISLAVHPRPGPSNVRVASSVGMEVEKLGVLGRRMTPLLVGGVRFPVMRQIHLSAHAINSRAADRQGTRATLQVSMQCMRCPFSGHAAWSLHPREGGLFSAGGDWTLTRFMSIGMGAQSHPLTVGFRLQITAVNAVSARISALAHHNTPPTQVYALRIIGGHESM